MGFIVGALKIIIVLGTLITIHELGHFLVSKACNVKVHKFAIGFGPKIFYKQGKETEYAIRLIPFGGFVQLEGEETRSDDPRAFNNKPVWQRMLIIVAGAFVNIIFALFVYYSVCVCSNTYITSQLAKVDENTRVYEAGLRADDKILSINNHKTLTMTDVKDFIKNSKTDDMVFEIERKGKKENIQINIPKTKIGLIGVAFTPDGVVSYVTPNSAASEAGIEANDKFIAVNEIYDIGVSDIVELMRNSPEKKVSIKYERNGELNDTAIIPQTTEVRLFDCDFTIRNDMNFFENSYYAINETFYYFGENIKGLAQIFTGKNENVEFMGVVGIAQEITSTKAVSQFFMLMSAISLSLGIFNLIPIPALDGGKFLLLLIELIRKKPINEKTEMNIQLVGFSFIMFLAIYITINDIIKLF